MSSIFQNMSPTKYINGKTPVKKHDQERSHKWTIRKGTEQEKCIRSEIFCCNEHSEAQLYDLDTKNVVVNQDKAFYEKKEIEAEIVLQPKTQANKVEILLSNFDYLQQQYTTQTSKHHTYF